VRPPESKSDSLARFGRSGVTRLPADGVTSLRAIADAFNDIETPRGGAWGPSSVRNLFARVAA
jgi:hypothetical protein